MKNTIEYIPIELLSHHPDNPRKDLGDLTELADSIKKSGIMQNLTVVPDNDNETPGYLVVIGNRRLEASKLAGLEELPCVISDMSYSEQLSTMLVENMSRSDLTVYEQAQGFQMLLDLDYSVEQIAEKSGFSESTVRKRVKLLELDRDKFAASQQRGVTLFDYEQLNKIKSVEKKNELLEKIGTKNFQMAMKQAITEQEDEENIGNIVTELSKFAEKKNDIDYKTPGVRFDKSFYGSSFAAKYIEKPADADTVKYYYKVTARSVELYKEVTETEDTENVERKKKFEKEEALRQRVKELENNAFELRKEFIKELTESVANQNLNMLIPEMLLCAFSFRGYSYYEKTECDLKILGEILGAELDGDEVKAYTDGTFLTAADRQPCRTIATIAYSGLDKKGLGYSRNAYYHGNPPVIWQDNERLNNLYKFLKKFGYQMSDDEVMLQNGTHSLFEEAKRLAEDGDGK